MKRALVLIGIGLGLYLQVQAQYTWDPNSWRDHYLSVYISIDGLHYNTMSPEEKRNLIKWLRDNPQIANKAVLENLIEKFGHQFYQVPDMQILNHLVHELAPQSIKSYPNQGLYELWLNDVCHIDRGCSAVGLENKHPSAKLLTSVFGQSRSHLDTIIANEFITRKLNADELTNEIASQFDDPLTPSNLPALVYWITNNKSERNAITILLTMLNDFVRESELNKATMLSEFVREKIVRSYTISDDEKIDLLLFCAEVISPLVIIYQFNIHINACYRYAEGIMSQHLENKLTQKNHERLARIKYLILLHQYAVFETLPSQIDVLDEIRELLLYCRNNQISNQIMIDIYALHNNILYAIEHKRRWEKKTIGVMNYSLEVASSLLAQKQLLIESKFGNHDSIYYSYHLQIQISEFLFLLEDYLGCQNLILNTYSKCPYIPELFGTMDFLKSRILLTACILNLKGEEAARIHVSNEEIPGDFVTQYLLIEGCGYGIFDLYPEHLESRIEKYLDKFSTAQNVEFVNKMSVKLTMYLAARRDATLKMKLYYDLYYANYYLGEFAGYRDYNLNAVYIQYSKNMVLAESVPHRIRLEQQRTQLSNQKRGLIVTVVILILLTGFSLNQRNKLNVLAHTNNQLAHFGKNVPKKISFSIRRKLRESGSSSEPIQDHLLRLEKMGAFLEEFYIQSGKKRNTIKKELELIKKFVDIEFSNNGTTIAPSKSIKGPSKQGEYLSNVPTFSIVNLVYNSFKHGLIHRVPSAKVKVLVTTKLLTLRVEVSDNSETEVSQNVFSITTGQKFVKRIAGSWNFFLPMIRRFKSRPYQQGYLTKFNILKR
ncbi:MAG: hypothetical protein JJ975_15895 [Bacteroidia bacterium]|nr:hypothetical protein [Bacteroidia bacterium]